MRSKFVEYMTEGIPVEIPPEDQETFYVELDKFINSANNDFESVYNKTMERVSIYDKFFDYLNVSYQDSRIIFMTSNQPAGAFSQIDKETQRKIGEAFLGVVLFVESIAPSEDSNLIPRKYHDSWCIQ